MRFIKNHTMTIPSDDTPSSSSWSMRGLKRWMSTAPETRDELVRLVQNSHKFLEPDTVDMLEGVLDLPATQVREIMTPRPNVVGVHETETLDDIMDIFLESTHSRYPVFDSQDDDAIIGILLAKDLIPLMIGMIRNSESNSKNNAKNSSENDKKFSLKKMMRQPVYINENARSDSLLRALQKTQVHMAVVVDDFGNLAGVVTMEDLLEEIVGDIIDEHDDLEEDSDLNNIIPHASKPNTWVVQASTAIDDCNEELGTAFDNSEVDTMGGLVMQTLGHVGDLDGASVEIDNWRITITHVEDARFIHTVEVARMD